MANSAFRAGGSIGWTTVAVNTQTVNGTGYWTNNAGTLELTLPVSAGVGSQVAAGNITGDFVIKQNANQFIQFGNLTTTVGVGGSITSNAIGDNIFITCRVQDLEWEVTSSVGAAFTVV